MSVHFLHGMKSFLNVSDFEPAARRILPRCIFEFIEGGAEDGVSLKANRTAFDSVKLLPRVLRDTSGRQMACQTLGLEWSAPFGIAPMGAMGVAAFEADLVMARAARKCGIPFVLSGASLVPLERIAAENPLAWFQAYPSQDAADNARLLTRVEASGLGTLVITVDVPVAGNRERDVRNGYTSPLRPGVRLALDGALHPRWLFGTFFRTLVREGMPHFENFGAGRAPLISLRATRTHRRDTLSWDWLRQLRDRWQRRLIIKGLLDPADVALAAAVGVDAVIVSNHGGRQLDGAVEPLAVLPSARQCSGAMEVFYDSGVRRGTDVLKALALGASQVFVGRPFLYAAVVGGEEGVVHAISLLRAEIDRNMALLGCTDLAELHTRVSGVYPPIASHQPASQ